MVMMIVSASIMRADVMKRVPVSPLSSVVAANDSTKGDVILLVMRPKITAAGINLFQNWARVYLPLKENQPGIACWLPDVEFSV